jgi:hypothetical protein
MGKMFEKGFLNLNDRVMSFMELSELYGKVCSIQDYNQLITALIQKWRRQVAVGGGRELVSLLNIKDQNLRRNKNSINRKVYQFHLRTRMLTAAPYRWQNSWEEIFYVQIPWYRVYEFIYKMTQGLRLRTFQLKLLYRILATKKILNIWGIQSSKLCRFCCGDTESIDHLFWYWPKVPCFWLLHDSICVI